MIAVFSGPPPPPPPLPSPLGLQTLPSAPFPSAPLPIHSQSNLCASTIPAALMPLLYPSSLTTSSVPAPRSLRSISSVLPLPILSCPLTLTNLPLPARHRLHVCLIVCLSICQSVSLSLCLSVCLCLCVCLCLSQCLSLHLCLSVCLSVSLSVLPLAPWLLCTDFRWDYWFIFWLCISSVSMAPGLVPPLFPLHRPAQEGTSSAFRSRPCSGSPRCSGYSHHCSPLPPSLPFLLAPPSDRSTTASALLDHGASVDAIDDKGRTSLCHAARYGSTDCIHVLAEHGADVFAVDEDGLNPLDIAEQNGRAVAAAALRKLEQRQRLQDKRLLRQKLDTQVCRPSRSCCLLAASSAPFLFLFLCIPPVSLPPNVLVCVCVCVVVCVCVCACVRVCLSE